MPARRLPARPNLDHLKHEAKALRGAFLDGEAAARARVAEVLGARDSLKLTEAQRVVAREYGFRSWASLRSHVRASRGAADSVDAFLAAVASRDIREAMNVLNTNPGIETTSVHIAAVLGRVDDVRRLAAEDPANVNVRAGRSPGDALLWLCYSPFHGESAERDEDLAATARVLLDAGADPNTRDSQHGVPALYAVTGVNNAPHIARMLLEAGAEPTDGESVFHAAERFHVESLELLRRYGVDLNHTGEWGNTPLYFLLRYWDVARVPNVRKGFDWLLEHGADPNVRCGRERESSLHVAVRRGQHTEIVTRLIEHGADVNARRGDGRTAWVLAKRGGFDELASLLETVGATPEPLSALDALLAACGQGDVDAARRLATPDLRESLGSEETQLIVQAAMEGRVSAVAAYLAAGWSSDTADENGATALHHAAINGFAPVVRELLRGGADFRIEDREHESTPLGWACFGADHFADSEGDYADTVRALLQAGAEPDAEERWPAHAGVRDVLRKGREPLPPA